MKNKKIIPILGIILLFFFVLIGTTIIVGKDQERRVIEKRESKKYIAEQTITCTLENGHDGSTETETVYMKEGTIITRTNTVVWSRSDPKEKMCEYYTQKSQGLNARPGISSTTSCTATSGNSTTIYTIAELDQEDIKLKQFDYMDENYKFDYSAWIQYMEKYHYDCKRS